MGCGSTGARVTSPLLTPGRRKSLALSNRAYDGAGRLVSEARLSGVNAYDFIAGMLSWGARPSGRSRAPG